MTATKTTDFREAAISAAMERAGRSHYKGIIMPHIRDAMICTTGGRALVTRVKRARFSGSVYGTMRFTARLEYVVPDSGDAPAHEARFVWTRGSNGRHRARLTPVK